MKYWYDNQFVQVKYKSSLSKGWKLRNGVRQGGILSGHLFNIYINSLLEKIANMKIGCKLGIVKSNIIAYADDIILLAPSADSLQLIMNEALLAASELDLEFNLNKTKVMKFCGSKVKYNAPLAKQFKLNDHYIENVSTFRYLGYIISSNLSNNEDIIRTKNKFYAEFNSILRKFSFVERNVKLFLFKQYCLQFYGVELWFGR